MKKLLLATFIFSVSLNNILAMHYFSETRGTSILNKIKKIDEKIKSLESEISESKKLIAGYLFFLMAEQRKMPVSIKNAIQEKNKIINELINKLRMLRKKRKMLAELIVSNPREELNEPEEFDPVSFANHQRTIYQLAHQCQINPNNIFCYVERPYMFPRRVINNF